MSDNVQQEFCNVLQALDGGFARMTRVFKSMQAGDLEEGFEKLARLSRHMQRSVRQALETLDPAAAEAMREKKKSKQPQTQE
jgi:hypothetical protein